MKVEFDFPVNNLVFKMSIPRTFSQIALNICKRQIVRGNQSDRAIFN